MHTLGPFVLQAPAGTQITWELMAVDYPTGEPCHSYIEIKADRHFQHTGCVTRCVMVTVLFSQECLESVSYRFCRQQAADDQRTAGG